MNYENSKNNRVLVIGAGLAGVEAAYCLAKNGVSVLLVDSKKSSPNPTQSLDGFAELVCTNSLKSKRPESSHGMLKEEMKKLGSIIIEKALEAAVPAGDALAVDRKFFSEKITDKLLSMEQIEYTPIEISDPTTFMKEHHCDSLIIASGPLTTDPLANWIKDNLSDGPDDLYFYDAMAPVVDGDSLDMTGIYLKDRYKDVGEEIIADYLNCPLTKEEYELFVDDLKNGDKTPTKSFEKPKFFEGCLPIDLMAERGVETLRFSCMKPVGLERADGKLPHAVIQLRRENLLGNAFNLVGFQTRLTHKEQLRIFRKLPGFANAKFFKLGSVHRNTYLNAKKLLAADLSSKKIPNIYFAGQITGVEGYTESAAMGIVAAMQVLRKIRGEAPLRFPVESAIGALINYIMTAKDAVPSNINFGLFPPPILTKEQRKFGKRKKDVKKNMICEIATKSFDQFLAEQFFSRSNK